MVLGRLGRYWRRLPKVWSSGIAWLQKRKAASGKETAREQNALANGYRCILHTV